MVGSADSPWRRTNTRVGTGKTPSAAVGKKVTGGVGRLAAPRPWSIVLLNAPANGDYGFDGGLGDDGDGVFPLMGGEGGGGGVTGASLASGGVVGVAGLLSVGGVVLLSEGVVVVDFDESDEEVDGEVVEELD